MQTPPCLETDGSSCLSWADSQADNHLQGGRSYCQSLWDTPQLQAFFLLTLKMLLKFSLQECWAETFPLWVRAHFHRSQSASPHPTKREHLETRGASPGQQNNPSCSLPWYCRDPRGRIYPLPRKDKRGLKWESKRKQFCRRNSYFTLRAAPRRVSAWLPMQKSTCLRHTRPCNCTATYKVCNSNAQHGYASAASEPQRCHEPQLIIHTDVISRGMPCSCFSRKAVRDWRTAGLPVPGQERPCTSSLCLGNLLRPAQSMRHSDMGCLHKKLCSSCDAQGNPDRKRW